MRRGGGTPSVTFKRTDSWRVEIRFAGTAVGVILQLADTGQWRVFGDSIEWMEALMFPWDYDRLTTAQRYTRRAIRHWLRHTDA